MTKLLVMKFQNFISLEKQTTTETITLRLPQFTRLLITELLLSHNLLESN